MKNPLHFFFLAILCTAFAIELSAQHNLESDEFYVNQIAEKLSFINQQPLEIFLKENVENLFQRNQVSLIKNESPIITIPIVVHVLWNENNPDQNITEKQIRSQIYVLNKDFQLKNNDSDKCPERFKKLQANCQIAFRLACRDERGNPTNGIERRKIKQSSYKLYDDDPKYFAKGGLNAWNRDQYLNIWVVPDIIGAFGYAQRPGENAETDGIVIMHSQFGVSSYVKPFGTAIGLGRTATHEVGHWLNLNHIWGFCIASDFDILDPNIIDDTPKQLFSHKDECPDVNNPPITCLNGPNGDMFMNFMDETKDECMNMFTLGQKKRMHKLFEPGGLRYPLLFSKGCTDTLIPDLVIQNEQAPSTPIAPGDIATVSCKNKNQGTTTASSSYTAVWLSQDEIFDGAPKDINLHLDLNVPALNVGVLSNTLSGQVTIPPGTSPGTWYIMFGADATSQVNEGAGENNNQIFVPITVSSSDCNSPFINTHPTNKTVAAPAGTYFNIIASGSNNLYQWQYNTGRGWSNVPSSSLYSGVNTTTLNITSTSLSMNGYQYRCYVSSSCTTSTETSKEVILTIQETSTIPPSKDPNCKENHTGDYCFQNNTKLDLKVTFWSSQSKTTNRTATFSCTLQPGQRQCFFDVPAGAARYEISNGGYINVTKQYYAEGSLFVDPCHENTFFINLETPSYSTNIPTQTNENKNQISKDADCKENNTGDYCFQNNTKLDLKVTFWSSQSKTTNRTATFTCTIQPGQRQCFFDVPAGAARYEISNGGYINVTKQYYAEGSLFVDLCHENTFVINLETPSYSTNIPAQTNENKNQISKDPNCKENYNGDYCFQNNTKLDLKVTFWSSQSKITNRSATFTCTLQPGQRQCFFDVPAGAARYEISNGGYINVTKQYYAEGSLYVAVCQENTFIIR